MTVPEVNKKTGEAHDIHGSPKPGDKRGAKIGDQGGDYYKKDDEEADTTDVNDHADLETNDEPAVDTTEARSKGNGIELESNARTSGLVSTNL